MIDPNIQALNEEQHKIVKNTRRYAKLYEETVQDFGWFKTYISDCWVDDHGDDTENELRKIHKMCIDGNHEMSGHYYMKCHSETQWRLEHDT